MNKFTLFLLAGGVVILSLGLVLGWTGSGYIIKGYVKKTYRLYEGGSFYKEWIDPPEDVRVILKFHFFNLTNPQQVMAGEEKPKVEEKGPYSYLQEKIRANISKGELNETIRYTNELRLHFLPHLSSGSEYDRITHPNIPLITIVKLVSEKADADFNLKEFEEKLGKLSESVFSTSQIRDLMFEGIPIDPLLDIVSENSGNLELPELFLDGKYAIYAEKNWTNDGVYEIFTGMENTNLGQIYKWNNMTNSPWWEEGNCSVINATDGSMFSPFTNRETKLKMYSSELCRNIYFTFENDTEENEVLLHKFSIDLKVFQGVESNPENWCYCKETDNKTCVREGILMMSGCKEGIPLVYSSPHFYKAEDSIASGVEGLNPSPDLHNSFMELEPMTSVIIRSAKRFQMNVDLVPYENLGMFSKLKNVVMPVLWTEEFIELPERYFSTFHYLYGAEEAVEKGRHYVVAFALLLICMGALISGIRKENVKTIDLEKN